MSERELLSSFIESFEARMKSFEQRIAALELTQTDNFREFEERLFEMVSNRKQEWKRQHPRGY